MLQALAIFVTSEIARDLLRVVPQVGKIIFDLVMSIDDFPQSGPEKKEFVMNSLRKLMEAGDLVVNEFLEVDLPEEEIMNALDSLIEGIVTAIHMFRKPEGQLHFEWAKQEGNEL